MQSKLDDENTITLYKGGDENALKVLIDKYTSPIYNFTARLTNKNEAVDITQEVFIKAWKNIKHFDPAKASFKTWIFTIAKNSVTDFLRKKKSILFSDIETEENNISENILDEKLIPDEALQRLQDRELLNKTLEKLSLNHKTILTLHYQEDMAFEEIGKILDKPLNTVKSQHHRAIILLREMLK